MGSQGPKASSYRKWIKLCWCPDWYTSFCLYYLQCPVSFLVLDHFKARFSMSNFTTCFRFKFSMLNAVYMYVSGETNYGFVWSTVVADPCKTYTTVSLTVEFLFMNKSVEVTQNNNDIAVHKHTQGNAMSVAILETGCTCSIFFKLL